MGRTDAAGTVWLCRPGLADDPCTADLDATVVDGDATSAAIAAAFMPSDGKSPALVGVIAAGYAIAAAVYWPAGRSGGGTSMPA